jgi:hypothetical protein
MQDKLTLTFNALAGPTRRAILTKLAGGETTVKELAKPFQISAPAICRLRFEQLRPCKTHFRVPPIISILPSHNPLT